MSISTDEELKALQDVGRIVALTLRDVAAQVRIGVTTAELDAYGAELLARHGARSAPPLVYGFPGALCISVNDEAVHGVPRDRRLQDGDLVKLDLTAERDGFYADAALTVAAGTLSPHARRLTRCAEDAFWEASAIATAGTPLSDIGFTIEERVRRRGFRVLESLCGHGIGRTIHEEPSVLNYYDRRQSGTLTEGLVITIEPIVAMSTTECVTDEDGWTVRTADGSLSAHFEHTLVVTSAKPLLLTAA
ncbi:MAG: type I methionyl aminopeptidase [Vicinamibacterales bacterium]